MYFRTSCSRAQQRFLALLLRFHMKLFEKTACMKCNINIFKIKTTEHMKKVFLESCYGLTVIVSSPDACLLEEDLCLPVVPLTLLSDSLADSWVVAVTTQLLSFFHMPYHLAQSSLHPMPVWECSQNTAPSEGFAPKPQDLLPGILVKLALLLEIRGEQLTGSRNFAQHSPEVLGSSDTLLCLGSLLGLKKGITTLLSGLRGWGFLMAPHLVPPSMTSQRMTEPCAHEIWRKGSASSFLLQ